MGAGEDARRAAREVRRNTAVRIAARSGYVASALLRIAIGSLALLLALHVQGARPDTSGAFGLLARVPGGVLLLALVAAGDVALGAFLLLRGAIHRGPHPLERWRQRFVYWGRGAVYLVIGATATRFALGAHASSERNERSASRALLEVPGGGVALAVIGGVIVVTGAGMVWIGLRRRFTRTVHLPRSRGRRRAVLVLGVVGYTLQGATIAAVGVFVVVAAFTVDPDDAGGLSGTLAAFAGSPGGRVALAVLAFGWIVAGLYALIRARIARLD